MAHLQVDAPDPVPPNPSSQRASVRGPLPTFLIVGAQKSGTRWLRANLGRHPDVYTATLELGFFQSRRRYEEGGVDWYRAQFGGCTGEPYVGEATPGYMMWRLDPTTVAERIEHVVPEVRLVAVLRNPIDRAYSAMLHHVRRQRIPPWSSLLELVRGEPVNDEFMGLVAGGWYAASLEPYQTRFREQLLVLLFDDIVADARSAYAQALRHIGAAPGFAPQDLHEIVYSNRVAAPRAGDGPSRIPAEPSPEERRALYEYFREDLRRLEELLERDFSIWDPTA
jgi:hypothetical protein